MSQSITSSSETAEGSADPDEPGSSPEPEPEPEAGPPSRPHARSCPSSQARSRRADDPDRAGSNTPSLDAPAEVEIIDSHGSSLDIPWIRDRLIEALPLISRPVARVCVMLVDDEGMSDLHRDHCGVEETTDVLAFPGGEEGEPIDVDIAACVDEARRRAPELGHPLEHELLLYALHGLLHAAGFDDHDEADYHAIHAEEDRILCAIGVGPAFRSDSPGHDDDRSQLPRVPRTPT
ncbi:MAG: rRNA maturation RNase YbeY [Phycisphaerales bacterium]|nr:MAG: rRNA maturation RNase YbeY [Phycisphaerales bacterium]